jgi:chromate reductase, NAD(P)H dehydrogenase (quinone)
VRRWRSVLRGGADRARRPAHALASRFVYGFSSCNDLCPGEAAKTVIKNAIDWVSCYRPQPFHARHGLLLSASPSMAGGNRGLWALRVPLEHLGARVFPDMFSLAQAHQALDDAGQLRSEPLSARFEGNIAAFMDLVEAAKHYPCAKKAWIEFLGEQPDAVTDRVE